MEIVFIKWKRSNCDQEEFNQECPGVKSRHLWLVAVNIIRGHLFVLVEKNHSMVIVEMMFLPDCSIDASLDQAEQSSGCVEQTHDSHQVHFLELWIIHWIWVLLKVTFCLGIDHDMLKRTNLEHNPHEREESTVEVVVSPLVVVVEISLVLLISLIFEFE
jgi:hypothetical protein